MHIFHYFFFLLLYKINLFNWLAQHISPCHLSFKKLILIPSSNFLQILMSNHLVWLPFPHVLRRSLLQIDVFLGIYFSLSDSYPSCLNSNTSTRNDCSRYYSPTSFFVSSALESMILFTFRPHLTFGQHTFHHLT